MVWDKEKRLTTAIGLSFLFMTVEIVGGIMANSLAILSDAAHLLTDIMSFVIALLAVKMAKWPADANFSYGYARAEALGALCSVALIWVLTAILIYNASIRIIDWAEGDLEVVDGKLMSLVSVFGICVNVSLALVFMEDSHDVAFSMHDHDHSHGHEHGHEQELVSCHSSDQPLLGSGSNSPTKSPLQTYGPTDNDDHDDHGHDHGHGHGHGHNDKHGEVKPAKEDHGHDHGHGHGHGHSDQHEEVKPAVVDAKDDHGHDHGHGHGHGHDVECGDHDNHDDHGAHGGHGAHGDSDMNMHAAYLHVLTDLVFSCGVLVAGLLVWYDPSLAFIDPIVTFVFSIVILRSTFGVLGKIFEVLFEGVPANMNYAKLNASLNSIPNVCETHDLHIWAISSSQISASGHIVVDSGSSIVHKQVLSAAQAVCKKAGIAHCTFQLEEGSSTCDTDAHAHCYHPVV
jgi:zinc transporter 2